jgi:hypothetical protein
MYSHVAGVVSSHVCAPGLCLALVVETGASDPSTGCYMSPVVCWFIGRFLISLGLVFCWLVLYIGNHYSLLFPLYCSSSLLTLLHLYVAFCMVCFLVLVCCALCVSSPSSGIMLRWLFPL